MTIESVALKTPFVDLLPPLSTAEFEALRLKIEREGFNPHCPVLVDEDGNILDGHNRYAIFPDAPTKTLHGLSEAEKQARVITENFARRNLSPEQKRELDKTRKAIARELKKEKWNQEEIARLFGVTQQTVSLWLGEEVVTNTSACISYHPDSRVKIPKEEHAAIFERSCNGDSQRHIAADYGVSHPTILKIVDKETKRRNREALLADVEAIEGLSGDSSIDVHPGEWWNLGAHTLYCGDTSQPEFYERVPRVEFAFADPPYGADVAEWDGAFYWAHDWLIEKAPIVAVTPGIVSIFEFARKTTMPYRWSMAAWIDNGMTRGALGFGNWVYMALFSPLDSLHRNAQDFVKVSIVNAEGDATGHKGQKPLALILHLIDLFTEEGTLVCDPFLGSGTTLLAAEKAKRACIGGEQSPEYCSAIIRRWEAMTGDKAVRANG